MMERAEIEAYGCEQKQSTGNDSHHDLMTFTVVVVSGWYCPILSGTIRAIILGQYKQHKL